MGKMNWARVVLCGMVAGLVWSLLSLVLLVLVGGDLLDAVPRLTAPSRSLYLFPLSVNFAMGIWAMWIYAAIRPRFGAGPKTAARAGFAWWVMYCLAKANWGPFGLISPKVLVALLAATLPALIVTMVISAWPYEE